MGELGLSCLAYTFGRIGHDGLENTRSFFFLKENYLLNTTRLINKTAL